MINLISPSSVSSANASSRPPLHLKIYPSTKPLKLSMLCNTADANNDNASTYAKAAPSSATL